MDIAKELEWQLRLPPFPMSAQRAWDAWQRLRRRKGAGFNGPAPIEWSDIDAFCRQTRTPLDPADVQLIELLDDLFLTKSGEIAITDRQQATKDGLKAAGTPKMTQVSSATGGTY